MTKRALHADFVRLRPNLEPGACSRLLSAAAELGRLPAVDAAFAVVGDEGSDFDLAFLFALDLAEIEAFGTDSRYVRFLQGTLAPSLLGLAGIDAAIESGIAPSFPFAACLALSAREEAYDWEVRDALDSWVVGFDGAAPVAVGIAAGPRQRFRGVAVVGSKTPIEASKPDLTRFESVFVKGRVRPLS